MPSPKSASKGLCKGGEDKNRRGKLAERASSFHGRSQTSLAEVLPRPRTVPDLLSGRNASFGASGISIPKLTKVLLKVEIQRCLGTIHVLMSSDDTVDDLISSVLRLYVKEARRPILASTDPSAFNLHYSQFSLESLNREEKLSSLNSRNFYVCLKKFTSQTGDDVGPMKTPSSSCLGQADNAPQTGLPLWLKLMGLPL